MKYFLAIICFILAVGVVSCGEDEQTQCEAMCYVYCSMYSDCVEILDNESFGECEDDCMEEVKSLAFTEEICEALKYESFLNGTCEYFE